jgi:hypothetical protein
MNRIMDTIRVHERLNFQPVDLEAATRDVRGLRPQTNRDYSSQEISRSPDRQMEVFTARSPCKLAS